MIWLVITWLQSALFYCCTFIEVRRQLVKCTTCDFCDGRFFCQKHNDAAKNDKAEKLDDVTMQKLRELGAFGLQASEKYGYWLVQFPSKKC